MFDRDTMSKVILQFVESLLARWQISQIMPKLLNQSRRWILRVVGNVKKDAFVGSTGFSFLPSFSLLRCHQHVHGSIINALLKIGNNFMQR